MRISVWPIEGTQEMEGRLHELWPTQAPSLAELTNRTAFPGSDVL